MKIVISDTTALIIFSKANTLFLLDNFKKISIKNITNFKIFNNIKKLNIDRGETESITLALELKLGLMIDEKKGRKIAQNQGLNIIGVLGIIFENFHQNFLSYDEAIKHYNLLKEKGLRISPKLEEIFYSKLKAVKG